MRTPLIDWRKAPIMSYVEQSNASHWEKAGREREDS